MGRMTYGGILGCFLLLATPCFAQLYYCNGAPSNSPCAVERSPSDMFQSEEAHGNSFQAPHGSSSVDSVTASDREVKDITGVSLQQEGNLRAYCSQDDVSEAQCQARTQQVQATKQVFSRKKFQKKAKEHRKFLKKHRYDF